jgi:hypothetical protein
MMIHNDRENLTILCERTYCNPNELAHNTRIVFILFTVTSTVVATINNVKNFFFEFSLVVRFMYCITQSIIPSPSVWLYLSC